MSESRRLICAYTPVKYDGYYPPYLNVSYVGGDVVEVTARGPSKPDGTQRDTVVLSMSRRDFMRLVAEGARRL